MELNNKSIIITDKAYFKKVFLYRNKYAKSDIKIYTKADIVDKLSFIYVKDPIPFLINNMHIEYSKAKRYASILRIADYKKNEYLLDMYNKLYENGFIKDNDLSNIEFREYKIYILELKEDIELKNILKRNNYGYTDISFNDLDIYPTNNLNDFKILLFKNKYNQFDYIFSNIRKVLLNDSSLKNKINILIDNEADLYYLNMFSNLYKIDYITSINRKIIENRSVKNLLTSIYDNKSLDIEVNDDCSKIVKEYIDKFELDKLDFNFAYLNLVEILSSYTYREFINDRGIIAKSNVELNDSINYVTNFIHNSFYKEYPDKGVLSDLELKEIGLNESYINTILDRNLKLNYLLYNNISILSRCELHLSDSIFDSQFVEEFDLKNNIIKMDDNKNGIYTNESLKLLEVIKYDDAFYTKKMEDKKIRTYDHSFKGINDSYIKNDKSWHLTDLESYVNCPYKYYLNKVIPLYDDDFYNRALGTLIHHVFEDVYHSDYNYEKAFNEGKTLFYNFYKNNNANTQAKHDAFLSMVNYWLEKIVLNLRKIFTENMLKIDNTDNDSEIQVDYQINDGKETYNLSGRIDKIIWTKANNKKYYTIIDYKSGAESFNFKEAFLGKSIQLPLYYYAIENYNRNIAKNSIFGGFAIQHSYSKKIKDICNDEAILKNGIISGLLSKDEEYIQSMTSYQDPTKFYDFGKCFDNAYRIIMPKNKKSLIYNYKLDDLVDDSINATIQIIKNILNNIYPINPTPLGLTDKSDNNMSCNYCGYKDVCYKNSNDYKYYHDVINNKFKPLELDEGGDSDE